MKAAGAIAFGLLAASSAGFAADDVFDRVDEALSVSAFQDAVRARVSGTLDLEGFELKEPAPSLIYTDHRAFFNPRLSLFLDAQLGSYVYLFAESRADRGFDPAEGGARMRLDEYAVRITPGDSGAFNFQAGKFATVVGNWVSRHASWDNPFITAPLPYENLTGIWDTDAARSGSMLLAWAGVHPKPSLGGEYLDRSRSVPVIWGPSYASGASVFGRLGKVVYALEVKNAALSSRPGLWDLTQDLWRHPTVSGRLGYAPNEMWNLGFSASEGSYLRPTAAPTLAPGRGLGDYREIVLAQDFSFAWHHFQAWAELYEARFAIPAVGHADTLAYYAEAKLKFTPQFFGSVRWNQQLFSSVPDGRGGSAQWGRDVWRIDIGPGYRFTPHIQLKLQASLQHENADSQKFGHLIAAQFTVRF